MDVSQTKVVQGRCAGRHMSPQGTGLLSLGNSENHRSQALDIACPGGKDWGVGEQPVFVASCVLQGLPLVGARQRPLSGKDAS